jgi:hypothetical protein
MYVSAQLNAPFRMLFLPFGHGFAMQNCALSWSPQPRAGRPWRRSIAGPHLGIEVERGAVVVVWKHAAQVRVEGRWAPFDPMSSEFEVIRPDEDVAVWLAPDGGINIKAVTVESDPVELSSTQARQLAEALLTLADRDDAD